MAKSCIFGFKLQQVLLPINLILLYDNLTASQAPSILISARPPELTPGIGGLARALHMLTRGMYSAFAPTATFNFQPFSKTKKLGVISRLSWGSDSTWKNSAHDWVPKTKALVHSLVFLKHLQHIPQHQQVGTCGCVKGHGMFKNCS